MTYKYKELFSDFVNKYLSSIDLEDLYVPANGHFDINIIEICERLKIKVEYGIYSYSGQSYPEGRTIHINKNEPEVRQRFTMAHEIGHVVMNHSGNPFRVKNNNTEIINQHYERMANKFAAELLMPRKLIIFVMFKHINENDWDSDRLTELQIELLTKWVASDLKVSVEAINYRIANERLFA